MLAQLEKARRDIARHLAEADPDRVTTAQAVEVLALFAEIERLGSAGKVLFTRRASQGTAWRDEGHRSAASWMAQKTGTGLGDAVATLETAEALAGLPRTTEALRRGELSGPQVKVIAAAAASHPDEEKGLLHSAGRDSFKALKERAAAVRATACSAQEEKARYLAVHRARYVRHWADPDGAFRLDAKLTPDAGARLLSALQTEADARFSVARKAKTEENPAAYQADALVALVTGDRPASGRSDSGRATVCIRVDGAALKRGFTKSGETCHIPGVGPVPVATVRRQLADAHVKILVRDGKDVTTVCHAGRTVTAHVQSALEERDPSCVVPGCDVALGLENHHWDVDYVTCKTTSLSGLARVCHWHHGLLSYGGYTLEGEPGSWVMRGPPGGDSFETGPPRLDSS
ncbi:MAG: DUF222 domain-containing protein [Acidimicrobiales bacterium]